MITYYTEDQSDSSLQDFDWGTKKKRKNRTKKIYKVSYITNNFLGSA